MASLLEFCQQLPKVELHAHLNGSISSNTMQLLLERRSKKLKTSDQSTVIPNLQEVVIKNGETRKVDSAFEAFKLIHSVVDDEEAITLAAQDVVREFYKDNVRYLELRTTPRPNPETGMTKESYVKAVMNGITKGIETIPVEGITVRLLLSVDRRQSIPDAYETVRLAHQYTLMDNMKQGRVVGLDLSGYPKANMPELFVYRTPHNKSSSAMTVLYTAAAASSSIIAGNTKEIVTLLNEAKKLGLKLSVHMAERSNTDEDSEGLLSVGVDRIGHGTFLHRGPQGTESPLVQHILNNRIPIELCMTSNVKGQTVESYKEHHFKFWSGRNHPVVLCTDDKGVFATTLSEEYCIAGETFGLTNDYLRQLAKKSVNFIFEDKACKTKFQSHFS